MAWMEITGLTSEHREAVWVEETEWPVKHVKSEEPGSNTGQHWPTPVREGCQSRLESVIWILIDQMASNNALLRQIKESNTELIAAMAEDAGESDGDEPNPTNYLNQRKS